MWLVSFRLLKGRKEKVTGMRIKRKLAFRLIALLMLNALAIMPMMPAGASPEWDWIPGTYSFHCQEGSHRNMSLCTAPTDAVVTDKNVPYGCQQGYKIEYSEPWAGGTLVNVTVPAESYHSNEFYVKPMPLGMHLWVQVIAVGDGFGTLALANISDVSPVSITVTGNPAAGAANTTNDFTVNSTIGDGVNDGAGACMMYMPLNLSVWFSSSNTTNTKTLYLFDMNFSMVITTGFTEVNVTDTTPYPVDPGNATIAGYYMSATGVNVDANTKTATLVGAGAGLDVYYYLDTPIAKMAMWTDFIFVDVELLAPEAPVGGVWTPVDKLALLAPYVGLASAIILAVAATAVFFRYRKKL